MDLQKIRSTLYKLNVLYNEASTESNFQIDIYCKLAALELCGWIEETNDELVIGYMERYLSEKEVKDFKSKYIQKVHGFNYQKHLRPLLINLLGVILVSKMEMDLKFEIDYLEDLLDELYIYRCKLAHRQYFESNPAIGQAQISIDAPSKIIDKFNSISHLLTKIGEFINNIDFSKISPR